MAQDAFYGSNQGSWNLGSTHGFPDPFADMASTAMPESPIQMLRWCEFIFNAQGSYSQAIRRVMSYFITDVKVMGDNVGDDDKTKWLDYLNDTLGIKRWLQVIGRDYICYGNAYVSVLMPFRRFLSCPKCSAEYPLSVVYNTNDFKFRWESFAFKAHCPACHFSGDWGKPIDRRGRAEDVIIKRWNPHEIELVVDLFTDKTGYVWKIPPDYKRQIDQGHLHAIERAPWELLQAVKNNSYFRFADDVIFHLKDDALAGIRNRGWGIPQTLINFRQVWYVQILHRYNEALALDYIIPFRVITPVPQGGAGGEFKDPLLNFSLSNFTARINTMLRRRRRDPASWNVLPFPVQYQSLGGDARTLAPRELLDQGIEILLNNVGVPIELYKGSLQVQAAPAALRLFESHWSYLPYNLNRLLKFFGDRLAELLSWEPVKLKLEQVTVADDVQEAIARLQLMGAGQISRETGLRAIHLDWKDELRKIMDEQRFEAQQQAELQDKLQEEALGQQLGMAQQPPGAAPGQPAPAGVDQTQAVAQPAGTMGQAAQGVVSSLPMGPNVPITPEEQLSRANDLANRLMALPDSQRQSEMISLKRSNPTLHSLVKGIINDIRQKARTVGGSMVLQQQFQQGGQPPAA